MGARIGSGSVPPYWPQSTPPKLAPPAHSTAASGTLPIEHTKVRQATTGPISASNGTLIQGEAS